METQTYCRGQAPLTLHQRFERQAAETPDAPALTFSGETLSYAELNACANRLAHYLRACGVREGMLVGLCLERGIDTVVAILAVLKSGGAYVPMDPIYPPERVQLIVDDAQCPIVLCHAAYGDRFAKNDARVLVLDDSAQPWAAMPADDPDSGTSRSSLAYVIYTSGSTGKPKGALITHWNVDRLVTEMAPWFNFSRGEVWTLFHSYAFDFSVWEIWGAFFHGGRVVVVPHLVSRSPEAFYQLLIDEGVTVLNQTPSAFRQLQLYDESVSLDRSRQLSLRLVIFGGEVLDLPGLRFWFDRHGDKRPRLVNMYGLTETTVFVTYRPVTMADTAPETPNFIGVPIPDLKLYVLDDRGQPVGPGGSGELFVGGAGVGKGYLNRPELTRERFLPDPFTAPGQNETIYKTGDLVRVWDGDLEFLGRNDSQIQLRGFRVELGEIESALGTIAGIQGATVCVREFDETDQRLVAYYLAKETIPADSLREQLARSLPPYMLPYAYVRLDRFPLNNNGKLDLDALPTPRATAGEGGDAAAPQSEVELRLSELWTREFNIPAIGREDNFFSLGGHSLLAIRLMAQINGHFLCNLPLGVLFLEPTIAGLARQIEASLDMTGQETPEGPALMQRITPGNGKKQPFFCVTGAADVSNAFGPLARLLAPDQPMYGFSEALIWRDGEGIPSVEDLATICIREMKAVKAEGPYMIGGYSFGGIVAFEMARQLIESGDGVSQLIILDTTSYYEGLDRRKSRKLPIRLLIPKALAIARKFVYTWKLQAGYCRDGIRILLGRLIGTRHRDPGEPTFLEYLRWIWSDTNNQYEFASAGLIELRFSDRRLEMARDTWIRKRRESVNLMLKIWSHYTLKPLPLSLVLLRVGVNPLDPGPQDLSMGWDRYAELGVDVRVLPGSHLTMYREPFVRDLAVALQEALERGDARRYESDTSIDGEPIKDGEAVH